jgi:hypothetical protein
MTPGEFAAPAASGDRDCLGWVFRGSKMETGAIPIVDDGPARHRLTRQAFTAMNKAMVEVSRGRRGGPTRARERA